MMVLCLFHVFCALLYVLSSFAIILKKRELVALLYLTSWCLMSAIVLWLFFVAPWVGLQCVFPDHARLPFCIILKSSGHIKEFLIIPF